MIICIFITKSLLEVVLCSDYANSYHRRPSAPDDSQQPFNDFAHWYFNPARTKSVMVITAVLLSAWFICLTLIWGRLLVRKWMKPLEKPQSQKQLLLNQMEVTELCII